MSGAVQAVSSDFADNNAIADFVEEHKVTDDFRKIAVIGPQSSGKSYLLNKLFGTKFDVLDGLNNGVQQTTQGVWLAADSESKTLVFDVEGSDSNERARNGNRIEAKVALYALAVSDLLLINVDTKSLGTEEASCTALLRTVLKANSKLFGEQAQKKQLVFVLRDFRQTQFNAK